VVREVTYLGALKKYLVETQDGALLQARVQVGHENGALKPGEAVSATWRIDDGVCVPAPAGRAPEG